MLFMKLSSDRFSSSTESQVPISCSIAIPSSNYNNMHMHGSRDNNGNGQNRAQHLHLNTSTANGAKTRTGTVGGGRGVVNGSNNCIIYRGPACIWANPCFDFLIQLLIFMWLASNSLELVFTQIYPADKVRLSISVTAGLSTGLPGLRFRELLPLLATICTFCLPFQKIHFASSGY